MYPKVTHSGAGAYIRDFRVLISYVLELHRISRNCCVRQELDHVVRQFDESYNQVVNRRQMDLHVRYWDTSMNMVRIRHYNSEFLGKAAATDVLEKIRKCMSGLDENTMLFSLP